MKNNIKRFATGLLVAAALVVGGGVLAAVPDMAVHAQNCNVDQPFQGYRCAKPSGAQEQLFGEGSIFQTVANILIFIVGIIAVIMLIIGGIRYAISGGDDSNVKAAKNTILYAIVGLVVAFLAFAAVNFVVTQLNQSGFVPVSALSYWLN